MKIAFSYKGTFNIDYIKKYSVDKNLLNNANETITNHFDKIFSIFEKNNYNYDIFISTYDIDKNINDLWLKKYKPKKSYFGNSDYSSPTHIPQLLHFKRLIDMILNQQSQTNQEYDLFVFTRFDIKMFKNFNELNIDYDSFNIVFKNSFGNCDDNFFIFNKKFFNSFVESINSLYSSNKIIHEINHELVNRGINIHYMENFNPDTYMGHNAFEFVRCGSNPEDPFGINSNFKR